MKRLRKEDKSETIFECQGENSISVTSTGKFRYSKDRDGSDLFVPEVSIKSKALSDAVLSGEPRNVNTAPINHTLPKGTTLNFSGFFDRLDPNFFGAINLSFKDKRASTEISLDKKLFYWNSIDLNLEKMTASVYLSTAVQDDGEDGMMHFAWKGFKSCTQEKNKFLYLLECLTADKAQRDFGRACKEKKF